MSIASLYRVSETPTHCLSSVWRMIFACTPVIMAMWFAGCSSPEEQVQARLAKIEQVGERGEVEDLSQAVEGLSDPSPQVWRAAARSAEQLVGTGIRVLPNATDEQRRAATESYRRFQRRAAETGVTYVVDSIPQILDELDDADEQVRREAGADIVRVMATDFGYQADASREARQQAIAKYRKLWDEWNAPGSQVVEFQRHPEKRRAFVKELTEKIKQQRAEGVDWRRELNPHRHDHAKSEE